MKYETKKHLFSDSVRVFLYQYLSKSCVGTNGRGDTSHSPAQFDPSPHTFILLNIHYNNCRHGHSVANGKDLIVSALEEGVKPEWGLSELGASQAERAGEQMVEILRNAPISPNSIVIFSSPFSRAFETAARIGSHLDIHLHDRRLRKAEALRERYFGTALEGKPSTLYGQVWYEDEKDITKRPEGGGESVNDVAGRLEQFVYQVEDEFQDHYIILSSHGDSLSILLSIFKGEDKRKHRQFGMSNCQVYQIDPTLPGEHE